MLKILKNISYSALIAVFAFVFIAIPSSTVFATYFDTEDTLVEQRIMAPTITKLLAMIKDREDFKINKTSLSQSVVSNRSEDFFFRIGKNSPSTVYGTKPVTLIAETDAGVRQIVVTTSCEASDSEVLLFSNTTCEEETWIIQSETNSGIKTFKIPLAINTQNEEDVIGLSFFACRHDGCVFEDTVSISYKDKITFADQLEVYDRYEWEYEWNDRIHHVQEVLLYFPYKDIRKIKLRAYCDTSGLNITTTEDNRVTCNERREYSVVNFRDYETDEEGNVYNLRIESVTTDKIVENSGAVELEFMFFNKKNRAHTVYYRPVQEKIIDE
jgi:hypothetical protein